MAIAMRVGLAAILFAALTFAGALPPVASSERTPPHAPAATPPYDVQPWFLGDSWTYFTTILTGSPDGSTTRARLNLTLQVAEVRSVTVGSLTYTAYNVTSNGTALVDGRLSLTGPGANPFQVGGPSGGWAWFDRSNLAAVAVNQTADMSGTVTVGIFDFPLTLNVTTTVRNTPALEDFDFPLELGDAWSFDGRANTTGFARADVSGFGTTTRDLSGEGNLSFRAWFNGTSDVGAFAGAARVHAVAPGGNTTDRWYHPGPKNFVKMETHDVRGPNDYFHQWTNLTAYSLVAPSPWPGSIVLSPPRVNPGGWLGASGLAMPDEDLVVAVPATGDAYAVRADGAGVWSLTFRAPTVDDFTPANADVGSHGVLVEPAASPAGWNATTLQLILPDLYVGSGDLAVVNPTPLPGQSVDLNGTVHASSAVGVSNSFNVSFSVDGVEIFRTTIPQLNAGGSATRSTTWIATTSGLHTVAFTADPDGEIPETEEANNTATTVVFVRGPDLSPWNITIVADSNATYVDPSAAGFVSAPVQARLGGTVTITFEAASVGDADVPAPFEVEVVETQGLRGPLIPGWRFSANTTMPVPPGTTAGPWTASWAVPGGVGVYHLNVTADAAGQVPESHESNNTFVVVVTVAGPDFRIASVAAPPKVTAGASIPIPVDIRNDGQRDAAGTIPFAAFEGMSPTPFFTANVPALAVGGTHTVVVSWTSPSPAVPSNLRFVADPADLIEEMDEANNEASATVDVRDPPITQIAWSGPNVTTPSLFVTPAATFALTALDRSDEGLATWYRIDGGADAAYATSFSIAMEGPHVVEYWSMDNLGGEEPVRSLAVTVDGSPPDSAINAWNRTGDRVTISLSATDAPTNAHVGVAYIEYRVDDDQNWTTYAGAFEVIGYGIHNVTYRAVDRLGHAEAEKTLPLTIPRAPAPAANLKPFLAAAFATVLFAAGLLGDRRRSWSLGSPRGVATLFALAEIGTGGASTASPALAVPGTGLGLAVDLVLLVVGLFAVAYLRRPRASEAPAGTDK